MPSKFLDSRKLKYVQPASLCASDDRIAAFGHFHLLLGGLLALFLEHLCLLHPVAQGLLRDMNLSESKCVIVKSVVHFFQASAS